MPKLGQLAEHLDAKLRGDPDCEIERLATLENASSECLAFFSNRAYRRHLKTTRAGAVLLREEDAVEFHGNCLLHPDPYVAFARLTALFETAPVSLRGVHPSAMVAPDAVIEEGVSVGPHAVIEEGVHIGAGSSVGANTVVGAYSSIGENCRLAANVTLYHGVVLGNRVVVHSGAVLGADGFGFAPHRGEWIKIHQLGGVVIGDDCEIGACTAIDRGALDNTVLERGVKIDNHCQIAHNVRVGEHTVMAAFVGISGSTVIGPHCVFAGRSGTVGHIEIAAHVTVTAASVVTKSLLEPGSYSTGTPLAKTKEWRKNAARFNQLDQLAHRVRQLEKVTKDSD